MKALGILEKEGTVFVLVDIQERFIPAMGEADGIIANADRLARASGIFGIPILVTEQHPKGLGHTTKRIWLPEGAQIIEKMDFGCFDCGAFAHRMGQLGPKRIVLFGQETHICILKTALGALSRGIEVHAVADAICSREREDKELGLERMRQSGAFIASTEMVLFQLMDRAGTDEFKEVRKLIR